MNEETLFHEALARSTSRERAAFLDETCAGQPELRAAVEALLAAHEQPGAFLCPPAVAARKSSEGSIPGAAPGEGTSPPVPSRETENLAGSTGADSRQAPPSITDGDIPGASARAAMPAADVPGRVGRYEIRRLLGRGGMGAVYLAHDPELDRPVALKIPKLAGPDAEERFLREARAAAAVSHPNLCPVYDAGRADGVLYLAMAYVPGPTLTEVLRQDGPLPITRSAAIAVGVARGMAEAHRNGIVHRDLKPGNILLDLRGEPVVTDFGLALRATAHKRAADPAMTVDHDPRLTQAGILMGTPAYMPPEQARGELDRMGPASDVYALGAILYELLAGRPPFPATPLSEMVRLIETQPAPLPSLARRGVPPGLDVVCRRALAKEPAERFPSMEAFAEALAPFAARGGGRRWGRVAVAAAAFALLLAVAGAVFYVKTDYGTVEVRISDPSADVQVAVDGNEITLTEGGRVTKLRAGPHALEVKGEGSETQTKLFKVTRGKNAAVEVELKPTAKAAAPAKPGQTPQTPDRARLAGLLARSRGLLEQGKYGELDAVADEALKIDPESPGALALRGTYRAYRAEWAAALADADAALKLNPETFQALVVRDYVSGEHKKYDESIADATICTRLAPNVPFPYANRARSYLHRGEYRQAIADATRAIELGYGPAGALLTRGWARACLGEYRESLADYDAAEKVARTNPVVLAQRSLVHARMGNPDKAGADRATVRKLDKDFLIDAGPVLPDPPKPPERKKLSAEEAGALAAALRAAEKALDQHRTADSRQAIDEAIRLDPTSANAHALRARLLDTIGQHEQAVAAASEAIRLDPNHAWAYTARGNARTNLKDPAGGVADHTIALRLDPRFGQAWNNRGYAYSRRGQYHQAVADLDVALRLRPDYVFALTNRGGCYLHLGEYERALADYARAADLQPTNGRWLMICAALRAKLGDGPGAAKDRERAIKIDPQLANAPGITLPVPIPPVKKDPEL